MSRKYKFDTPYSTKVTLTNWVRLTNAPLLLPRPSAVQWNEYVFLLTRDGTALLYHTKQGIWSVLPRCNKLLPSGPPPLTLHNGQILTMSSSGEILSYDLQYSQWETLQYPRLQHGLNSVHVAALTSNSAALLATAQLNNQAPPTMLANNFCNVHICHTNKWEKICDIGTRPLQSTALLGSDLYVLAGERVYKVTLPRHKGPPGSKSTPSVSPLAPPKLGGGLVGYPLQMPVRSVKEEPLLLGSQEQPTGIKSPPYTDSTLHVVKDTLFAFGGRDKDNQPTSDVLRYNPDTDSWESAGYMRSARYNVAVATVRQDSTYNVYAIGGSLGSSNLEMKSKINLPAPSNTLQPAPSNTLKIGGGLGGSSLVRGGRGGSGLVGLSLGMHSPQHSWECNSCITERCTALQEY